MYTDTLASSTGCDSIVITNLTINDVTISNQSFTLCEGESIMVGNNTYTSSGLFFDTLSSSLGCDSIVVTELFIEEQHYAGADTLISLCDTVVAFDLNTLLSSDASLNGTWIDVDQTGALNGSMLNPTMATTATYEFLYATTSDAPCTNDTALVAVTVDSCSILVSTNFDIANTAWTVYPNPSNGVFYLTNNSAKIEGSWIQVIDIRGQEIWRQNINSDVTILNFEELANQVYFLRVYSDQKTLMEHFKLILTK